MFELKPIFKNYLWGGKKFYAMYGRDNGEDFKAGDSFSIPCGESWEICGKADMILTNKG